VGGWARRGDAAVVVGRRVRGVVLVVGCCGGASLVVGRRGFGSGVGLRVVVGSRSRWARDVGCGPGAGSFVVGRLGAGARVGNRWCGSQRGVALRPCRRDARGTLEAKGVGLGESALCRTLETGCVDRVGDPQGTLEMGCVVSRSCSGCGTLEMGCGGWCVDRVVCDRVTICSGTAGVVA